MTVEPNQEAPSSPKADVSQLLEVSAEGVGHAGKSHLQFWVKFQICVKFLSSELN
jgi:hypothetical protein